MTEQPCGQAAERRAVAMTLRLAAESETELFGRRIKGEEISTAGPRKGMGIIAGSLAKGFHQGPLSSTGLDMSGQEVRNIRSPVP